MAFWHRKSKRLQKKAQRQEARAARKTRRSEKVAANGNTVRAARIELRGSNLAAAAVRTFQLAIEETGIVTRRSGVPNDDKKTSIQITWNWGGQTPTRQIVWLAPTGFRGNKYGTAILLDDSETSTTVEVMNVRYKIHVCNADGHFEHSSFHAESFMSSADYRGTLTNYCLKVIDGK